MVLVLTAVLFFGLDWVFSFSTRYRDTRDMNGWMFSVVFLIGCLLIAKMVVA